MIRRLLTFILAAAAACAAQAAGSSGHPDSAPAAQQQPAPPQVPPNAATPQAVPKPPAPPAPTDTAAAVPATEPVITVQGVCSTPARTGTTAKATPAKATTGGACKTVLTKAQFEKLLNAVNPNSQTVAPNMRRNLAQAYVELLTFSQAAQKAGVDKDPAFAEVMKLVRMRTLQDFYRRSLEQKYRNPPAADVQAYYNQNIQKYEEIKVSRIYIPSKNPSNSGKDDWEKKAAQEANDIHDRAAKGEDFEKLQKEAYTALGMTITPPSTAIGNRRRGMVAPQEEQELFAMKAGDVSKLEQEPAGYVIYKVEGKETLPLDKVKDDISRELFRQKMDSQIKAVQTAVHADLNEEYFGPTSAPPPRPGMPPGRPPGQQPGSAPPPSSQGQAPPK